MGRELLAIRRLDVAAVALRAVLGAVAAVALLAGAEPARADEGDRPKIGLALSGGGARGFAHVGVLEALETLRVPVDYIAGTSMGSVVGGVYASGVPAAELREVVTTTDWISSFDDRTPRREISFRRKQDSFEFLTGLRLWVKDFSLALPRGLVDGQKLSNHLAAAALRGATVRDFDELATPFRAVATDSVTGETVVIGDGELVHAMWASMAIPGLFTPVPYKEHQLVDGGVSNNLPIDVVKAMGADIVIAVDIAAPLMPADEVQSVFTIGGQSLTVLMLRNTNAQIELLKPDDLLIRPELAGLGSSSFDAAAELVARGAKAALEMSARLSALSLSEEDYRAHRARRVAVSSEAPVIDALRFDNRSPLSDAVIEEAFDVILGQPLDVERLHRQMAELYGEEIFDRVTYSLEATQAGTELIIRSFGKEQGRNNLRFGLDLETNFEGESDFNISSLLTRAPVNRLAGEWRTRLQVGQEMFFRSEFFQPLNPRRQFFVLPAFHAGIETRDLFDEGGDQLAKYRLRTLDASLAIGAHLSNWAELKLGLSYNLGDIERTSGDPTRIDDLNYSGGLVFASVTFDSLDSVTFPRAGGYLRIESQLASEELGGNDSFDVLRGSFHYAYTIGETTILPGLELGTTFRAGSRLPTFSLGGFLRLSGLPPDARAGSTSILARLLVYQRIANPTVISWSLPVYLGASLEAGNTFDRRRDVRIRDLDVAGSVFLGVDTFLGPIYVAYGHTEGGNNAGYLFLGQVF